MDNELILTLKNNQKFSMSLDTYAKWLCLLEAMEYINNSPSSKNLDFDRDNKWIKPIEFQKYLNARFHGMLHDLKIEEYLDF